MLFMIKFSTLAIKHDFPSRRDEMWYKRVTYLKESVLNGYRELEGSQDGELKIGSQDNESKIKS